MGNNYFQFKQFLIKQDKCAMKVGTDSVLLACLTDVSNCKTVLDIGTGTGIIALMLAQKNTSLLIDAIEIDDDAFIQAKENIETSVFAPQIQIHHGALQHFEPDKKFDLIISNPPYFIGKNNFSIHNIQRAKARHDDDLPFDVLIQKASDLLTNDGTLRVILPAQESKVFINLALQMGLYLQVQTYLKPKPDKSYNRVIIQLGKTEQTVIENEFTIYHEDGNQTEWYKETCKDFYL
ncbi:MAG: methyltransferase [Bacteroidota bacterium]